MNEDTPKKLIPEDYEDVYSHPELLVSIEEFIPEECDDFEWTDFYLDDNQEY
jgi:hypothetical protein